MSTRIFLADDHEVMREGLCALLRKYPEIEVVGQAADGRSTIKMVRELLPDIVIMDIGMPNLNGVEATRRIVHEFPDIKVMALSTHSDRLMVAKMLEAGASGYMLKESAFSELINGIKAIEQNKTYLCPQVANVVLNDYVNLLSDPKRVKGDVLTKREREVLQLVAEGRTSKTIAAELNVSVKTIDSHREHIMKKLGIRSIARLTKYAIRGGLTSA